MNDKKVFDFMGSQMNVILDNLGKSNNGVVYKEEQDAIDRANENDIEQEMLDEIQEDTTSMEEKEALLDDKTF